MTRSLVIAPQWIGDAVMTEPLLARLRARGERSAVAALPWVAPVYRAMPQVDEVIELPFAHGRLDWASAAPRSPRELRGRFDAAYVLPNSLKAALLPWLARHPAARRLPRRRPRRLLLNAAPAEPARAGRRWSRSTARSPAATPTAGATAAAAARRRDAARPRWPGRRSQRGGYWVVRARAPSTARPSAGRPTHYAALARALHAATAAGRAARLGQGGGAVRGDRRRGAGRVPRARRQDLAARGDGADRRGARPGQQRLGPDARRRRVRRAAGRGVRLDQPAAHAAAERARARALAEGRARPRLHALLRPHLPLRPLPLPVPSVARRQRVARRRLARGEVATAWTRTRTRQSVSLPA